jgi:glyoxylase-like metal-dependent hydrolase (beta-lactamase superfamily II)
MGLRVELRYSGIWQLTSAVLSDSGTALVVDPGYFPRELAELSRLAAARGQVAMVAFTHGHWDHVMGWPYFPSATVYTSPSLRSAIAEPNADSLRNLQEAADFDRRWYIDRGQSPQWPPLERTKALTDGEELHVGQTQLLALHLPGHSRDGLGLWAKEEGLLLVGDYLSPCEIPFVEDLAAYCQTLKRLLVQVEQADRILPGHGHELLRTEARVIAQEDLHYLTALAECAARRDQTAALNLSLPRAQGVKEMVEHHRDNCRAAGFSI